MIQRIMITSPRLWLARFLIGAVLFTNVQSALAFFSNPSRYAPAYELAGIPGEAAIQGFGILFLMWNVPYTIALIHPSKHRISLYEALSMQSIGLIGESLIFWGLPISYPILKESILRFIIFDGLGVLALLLATLITLKKREGGRSINS